MKNTAPQIESKLSEGVESFPKIAHAVLSRRDAVQSRRDAVLSRTRRGGVKSPKSIATQGTVHSHPPSHNIGKLWKCMLASMLNVSLDESHFFAIASSM